MTYDPSGDYRPPLQYMGKGPSRIRKRMKLYGAIALTIGLVVSGVCNYYQHRENKQLKYHISQLEKRIESFGIKPYPDKTEKTENVKKASSN